MIMLLLSALTSTAVGGGTPSALYVNCEIDPVRCAAKTTGFTPTRAPRPKPAPCQPDTTNYAYKQLIVSQALPTRVSLLQEYTPVTVILESKVLGNGPGVLFVKDAVLGKQLLKGFTVSNIYRRDGLIIVGLCYPDPPE